MNDAVARWWPSALRLGAGLYWLYFASQKWPPRGVDWMRGLVQSNPAAEPIPGLKQFLQYVVAPNWHLFAVLQGTAETVVGGLLILGLGTRWAGLAATALALELATTVAFESPDVGFRWLYYLAVLVSAQVYFSGPGPLSIDALFARRKPASIAGNRTG